MKKLLSKLYKINNLKVKQKVPLKEYTTFHVGGPADIFITPQNEEALKKLIQTICSSAKNSNLRICLLMSVYPLARILHEPLIFTDHH